MKHIIPVGLLCCVGWWLGGILPTHTYLVWLGFLGGAFVGIPAILIIAMRAQSVRHVYHYAPTEAPTQPRTETPRPRVRIAEKSKQYVPTRYTVVENHQPLPLAHRMLEERRWQS